MVSVFTRVEKATALAAWVAYVHRRRVMHIADRRRAVEMTVMCLAAWKTHVALERYFLHSFRRRTLTATFIAWRDDIRQRRWELTTDSRLRVFKMRQRLRRHFGEWKRTVMFLGWNSSRLIELGDDADHCYKRSVFERLKKRAGVALARERESEQLLRLRAARRPFRAWREVCHMRWRRRGNMLRRFFAHSRDAITVRRHTQTGYRAAIQYWLDTKRASYFRCWHKLTRQRTRGHGRCVDSSLITTHTTHTISNTTNTNTNTNTTTPPSPPPLAWAPAPQTSQQPGLLDTDNGDWPEQQSTSYNSVGPQASAPPYGGPLRPCTPTRACSWAASVYGTRSPHPAARGAMRYPYRLRDPHSSVGVHMCLCYSVRRRCLE